MESIDPIEIARRVLGADPRVVVAYVFGSVARGETGPGSDLDVAVLAQAELGIEARSRLAEDLSRAVGSETRVDVVDLRTAPPVLAAEVIRDGKLLVERDRVARFDLEMDIIRRFEDTRPLRRLQQGLLRETARGRP